MERLQIPDTENRLLLLSALQAIGPATDSELTAFLAECELMGYMDIQLNLSLLAEQHQVETLSHPLGPLYQPTEEGLFALASYQQRIPQSRRDIIAARGPAFARRIRLEQEAPLSTRMTEDHRLTLLLRLLNQARQEILGAELTLSGSAAGVLLQEKWQEAAAGVYAGLMQTLSEGFREGEDPAPLPQTADMKEEGGTCLLTLRLSDAPPELLLRLPFSSVPLARHCAARWPRHAQEIRRLFTRAVLQTKNPN